MLASWLRYPCRVILLQEARRDLWWLLSLLTCDNETPNIYQEIKFKRWALKQRQIFNDKNSYDGHYESLNEMIKILLFSLLRSISN